MNIVMMTNTYAPHVGGVARSVGSFTEAYRARGHEVLVVAPEFPGMPKDETGVVRIPAVPNFNGSDFSVVLPVPGYLESAIDRFRPDIVHSHHPFLIGSTALRIASGRGLPLVFTHHTMYEQYTHYVPGDSVAFKRFIVQLATSYANLCDCVFAPSESIAAILRKRDVRTWVKTVPTGVVLAQFNAGDGAAFRRRNGIPAEAIVFGHVGRLAPEKNLDFLAQAVARALRQRPRAHFLLVGEGPSAKDVRRRCQQAGVSERLHMPGKLILPRLADAYHAMDLFAFASTTETQGMVLAEAMAAGLPVVAIDAPGSREVVVNGHNGLLLQRPGVADFAAALIQAMDRDAAGWRQWRRAVAETAENYSLERCADKALRIYKGLGRGGSQQSEDHDIWRASMRRIRAEWALWKGVAHAAGAMAKFGPERTDDAS